MPMEYIQNIMAGQDRKCINVRCVDRKQHKCKSCKSDQRQTRTFEKMI